MHCGVIIISLSNYKREKEKILFILYIISTLLLFTLHRYISFYIGHILLDETLAIKYHETANMIFTIIEFGSFYFFFFRVLEISWSKKALKLLAGVMLFMLAWFAFRLATGSEIEIIQHISYLTSSVEMFLLIIPCLIYFYELFQKMPFVNLSQKPSFWITTGLFLYSGTIIPFFLIADKINNYSPNLSDYFFSAHYFTLGILFLLLSKAFSCKKPLTI